MESRAPTGPTEPQSQAGRELLASSFAHYNDCSGSPQYCNCQDLREELRVAIEAIETEMKAKSKEAALS